MTTTLTATFDGKVLIPSEHVDLPKGTILHVRIEVPGQPPAPGGSLSELEACGIWADRGDLADTATAARDLRRTVEARKDRADDR